MQEPVLGQHLRTGFFVAADDQTEALTNAIEQNAQAPASTSVDGVTVTNRSVSEQIEATRFVAAQRAACSPTAGLTFMGIKSPGAQR